MQPLEAYVQSLTRRHFFGASATGLGSVALSSMLGSQALGQAESAKKEAKKAVGGLPDLPHFAPKAKRVIYLFMNGAPSQLDMWDYKPKMDALFDKDLPDSIRQGQRLTTMTSGQGRFPVAPSKFKFQQHGQCRRWVSELLPWSSKIVDDLAVVKTVHTEAINHDPAVTYICTGNQLPGRASLGSWLSYGLGSVNENLPTFVVMTATWTGRKDAQAIYNRLWGSGFLASKYQGVALRAQGDPVLFLSNPDGVSSETRRRMLDSLNKLNQKQFEETADPEIQARIAQYEMAFRMQSAVPELMDLSKETKPTLEMYGPDVHKPGTFAASCLLARRLVERDVRFVQIFHRGWDQHGNLPGDITNQCKDIDQPCYALINDLKQRGLLEDTLVVWGGEFGRTIYCQGKLTRENYGRDHHPRCFTVWFAGAGVKKGIEHGETDDFSYNVVKDPVHIHDLNATILHVLGIDHRRFSVKVQGLDARLTGVEEHEAIKGILA